MPGLLLSCSSLSQNGEILLSESHLQAISRCCCLCNWLSVVYKKLVYNGKLLLLLKLHPYESKYTQVKFSCMLSKENRKWLINTGCIFLLKHEFNTTENNMNYVSIYIILNNMVPFFFKSPLTSLILIFFCLFHYLSIIYSWLKSSVSLMLVAFLPNPYTEATFKILKQIQITF